MTDKDAPRDAQIRADALDLNSDVFMAAGAGSGKTTVLVDRYMAALDAGVPPREVVAITFTRKAASEMRQRLRKECRDRIAEANADASRHWRQVADELEVAPINTIHGFCSSLLRRFALRAGVDPQFRVLQERSGWLMRQRAITETILQRLDDEKPTTTRLFSEYSRGQIEGIMDGLLNNREFFEDRLQHPPSVSDVQEHWNEIRDTLANDALRSVIGASKTMEALTTLREHPPVDPATKFSQEREVVLEALDGAGAVDMDYSQRWELAERALKAAEVTKSGASPEDWGGKENWDAVRDALNAVKTQLRNWRQQQEQLDDDAVMDDAAALAEAVWTEASACLQAYEEAKAADSSLDFVDLQLLIRKLLHADAQVRNQCRDRYRHVLVDEFQDTNDLQRDIVFAITGFVDDSRSPDAPKLFVVGDAKQSIYGFRNADVRVFRHTREQFAEASGAVRELALEVAFRSTASLTGYHNWLFDHETIMGTAEKPDYEARFEPLQAYRDDHPGGMAGEMLVTDVEAVEDENGEEKRPNAEQRREAEAATLAARLKELRESGFEVVDEDTGESRPMQWGDIALLLRATSNINLYENALRRHEIPFYTIGGIGFWTRQEVMDLLNMIRVLNNFNDDVALAGVLRSPLFGFDDNELYRVARAGETLFEGLKTVATGEFASEYPADADETVSRVHWTVGKLERFRMLSGILPLSRLLDRIIDETGYSGAMAAQFGGERRIANIRKLVDVSRGFERDGNYGLDEFVR
ncbi:MAG: UvrD-helicase domain-containing protein, partial [Armatimonadota bacterium]